MRVTQEIRDLVQYACDCCGCPELANKIAIEFNNRFTRRMGDATARGYIGNVSYKIRLSAPLWPLASEEERWETVIHEACHIIDHYLHGRMNGHQHQWISLMIKCDVKPERCHKVDRKGLGRRRSTVTCYCGCGTVELGKIQATRLRKGVSSYRCRKCKQAVSITPNRTKVG